MTSNWMAFFPTNFILQNPHDEHDDHHHQPSTTLNPILTSCTPQDFHGVASFSGKRSMSFSGLEMAAHDQEGNMNGEEELSDDEGSQAGEKKRRLNMEQVKTLEKNFELGNKLEPERKMQLARALGLQPRQIAIWFQNRRARWKTKQLEKDYDLLKRQFEAIKAENEALQGRNQKLQAEMLALRSREPTESINLNKETDQGSCSNRSENSSDNNIKLDTSRTAPTIDSPLSTHNHHHQHHHTPIITTTAAANTTSRSSPHHHHAGQGQIMFQSEASIRPNPPPVVAQLFQDSSSSRRTNSNIHDQMVKEESLSNIFCGIDDQSGFWPWLEQPHFN